MEFAMPAVKLRPAVGQPDAQRRIWANNALIAL